MIPVYEQLQRAKKGETIYSAEPARNWTSAASRLGRKITTKRLLVIHDGRYKNSVRADTLTRVDVLT